MIAPVDGFWEVLDKVGVHHFFLWGLVNLASEHALVLGFGEGGELVVAGSPGSVLGVLLLDEGVVLSEALHSEVVLFKGAVGETELSNVLDELDVEVVSESEAGKSGGDETLHVLLFYYNVLAFQALNTTYYQPKI